MTDHMDSRAARREFAAVVPRIRVDRSRLASRRQCDSPNCVHKDLVYIHHLQEL